MSSTVATDRPPPSSTSIVVATAILAVALGYFIGQGSSLGLFGSTQSASKSKAKRPKKSWPNSYDVTIHPDSSDEEVFKQIRGADLGIESEESSKDSSEDEEDEAALGQKQGDLNNFEGNKEECKLVLVVRTDLGMGKGTPISSVSTVLVQIAYLHQSSLDRQDRSPMLPCNPCLLPCPLQRLPNVLKPRLKTMGEDGSGESRCSGKERRRIRDAASASSESRVMRTDYP